MQEVRCVIFAPKDILLLRGRALLEADVTLECPSLGCAGAVVFPHLVVGSILRKGTESRFTHTNCDKNVIANCDECGMMVMLLEPSLRYVKGRLVEYLEGNHIKVVPRSEIWGSSPARL